MALNLYKAITQAYPEWLEWEPETVLYTLEIDGETVTADKVLAVQTIAINSNKVTRNSFVFEKVAVALCNGFPIMESYDKPHVEELTYAVPVIQSIVAEVHGISKEEVKFSGDVPEYVAAIGKDQGWVILPTPLSFAQEMLSNIKKVPGPIKDEYLEINEKVSKAPKKYLDSERADILRYVGAYLYNPDAKA